MVMMKHPNIHSSARHYLIHVNKRSKKSYSGGEVGEPAPQQAGWQGGVRACCLLGSVRRESIWACGEAQGNGVKFHPYWKEKWVQGGDSGDSGLEIFLTIFHSFLLIFYFGSQIFNY